MKIYVDNVIIVESAQSFKTIFNGFIKIVSYHAVILSKYHNIKVN